MPDDLLRWLCALVTPPKASYHSRGDWGPVERSLGTKLPQDYKRLIEMFGQGGFVGERFCSGLSITSYLGERAAERALGFSEYLGTVDAAPFKLFPEKPGLLGFGSYGDKDTIAWHTGGEPDTWQIVYHDPESGFHTIDGMSTLEFVVSMLNESSPMHTLGVIRMGNMKGPHTFCPER